MNEPQGYRAYRVSAGQHISASPVIIEAFDDEDAIAQASKLVDGVGIELWDRARCVIVLPPKDREDRA